MRIGRSWGLAGFRRIAALTVAGVLVAVAAACGNGEEGDPTGGVVATSSVIGDLATQVVGDCADVEVLVPPGSDIHSFEPSARQGALLRESGLVVANGLGLEGGLDPTLDSAEADGVEVLRLGPELDPMPLAGTDGEPDPHVLMDPVRAARAAELIGDAVVEHVGCDRAAVEDRVESYLADLEALDRHVAELLGEVPPEQRALVTNHDSMGYFARRYGFEVLGVIIPGGSTLAEPAPEELAELAEQIREAGVPAIFAETSYSTALADALASETGTQVEVVELYTESLGEPGSGAGSYTGMITADAESIAAALGG